MTACLAGGFVGERINLERSAGNGYDDSNNAEALIRESVS